MKISYLLILLSLSSCSENGNNATDNADDLKKVHESIKVNSEKTQAINGLDSLKSITKSELDLKFKPDEKMTSNNEDSQLIEVMKSANDATIKGK